MLLYCIILYCTMPHLSYRNNKVHIFVLYYIIQRFPASYCALHEKQSKTYYIISCHHSCFVWFHGLQGQQSTSYHNIVSYCIIPRTVSFCTVALQQSIISIILHMYCTIKDHVTSYCVVSYVSRLLSWYKPPSGFVSFHRHCLALFKNKFPASLLPQFLVVNAGELFRVGSCTSNRKTD